MSRNQCEVSIAQTKRNEIGKMIVRTIVKEIKRDSSGRVKKVKYNEKNNGF